MCEKFNIFSVSASLLTLIFPLSSLLSVKSEFSIPSMSISPTSPSGKDVTSTVFASGSGLGLEIFPVAYSDFNGDKLTDIITVDKNRTQITVYLANKDEPYMRPGPCWNFSKGGNHSEKKFGPIASVSVGDFNGDGLMDLMLTSKTILRNPFRNVSLTCVNSTHPENTTKYNATIDLGIGLNAYEVLFCSGDGKSLNCSGTKTSDKYFLNQLVQEPMALDFNHDMILDIVGEHWNVHHINESSVYNKTCNKTLKIEKVKAMWLSEEGQPATAMKTDIFNISGLSNYSMAHPNSNAYVDIDGDSIPELVLTTTFDKEEFYRAICDVTLDPGNKLELTFRKNSSRVISKEHYQFLGQPLFLDLERKGSLVHLIPYCTDKECSGYGIIAASSNSSEFHKLPIPALSHDGLEWGFIAPKVDNEVVNMTKNETKSSMEDFYSSGLTLRAGDYNLDGYPDLIATAKSNHKDKHRSKAVIFENVPCTSSTENLCLFSRTFQPNFNFLDEYENVAVASFFDVRENGIVDVVLVQEIHLKNNTNFTETTNREKNYTIRVFQNSPSFDSYFIKVMVLSGKPCPKCLEKDVPYANVIPGALIQYRMKDTNGYMQTAISSQLYRSTSITLDTPYTIFGIGHSPSWVEHLQVTLAYRLGNESKIFFHDSHQIIPNSQIIVLPSYPITEGMGWRIKLFLTPGKEVLHTFGVLMAIVVVVGGIASGLEYRERQVDKKERMETARRILM